MNDVMFTSCDTRCLIAGCPRATSHGGWPNSPGEDRWYITSGHPGYNSPANNRNGYKSQASAERAIRRYSMPRERRNR